MPFRLSTKTKLVIALSQSALTAAEFRIDRGRIAGLDAFSETVLDPGIIERGRLLKPRRLGDRLASLLTSPSYGEFRSDRAVLVLPEELFIHHVAGISSSQAGMQRLQLKKNIIQAICPLPQDQLHLTEQEHADEQYVRIAFSACAKADAARYADVCSEAGLKNVRATDWVSSALAHYFIGGISAEPVLWLHLGAEHSFVALADMHGIYRSAALSQSVTALLRLVQRRFHLAGTAAEQLLFDYGLRRTNPSVAHGAPVFVEQYVKALGDEAEALRRFYALVMKREEPLSLLASGRGSLIPGLVDHLSARLGAQPRLMPVSSWQRAFAEPFFTQEYSPLIGAALSGGRLAL